MASLKTLNKSFSFNNTANKSSTNTKSVLEKLRSLSRRTVSKAENPLEGLSPPKSSTDSRLSGSSTFLNSQNQTWELVKKILRYILAFLVLSFILLNILASLGLLPNFVAELFRPIFEFLGYNIGETVRKTVDTGVNILEEGSTLKPGSMIKALDDTANKYNKPDKNLEQEEESAPSPIETDDRAQRSGSKKSGYCYIGEDRGIRSCIKVNSKDECMSGDIFPTKEICINPNLRA